MVFFSGNILYDLVAIAVAIITSLVAYYKWVFTYWKRQDLEYLEPSIPFGNTTKLLTAQTSFSEQFSEFYDQFKAKGLKHGGVFMLFRPFYVPIDPVLVKSIMKNDFQHFVNRGFYYNEEGDPLSGTIFALGDDKWKHLRSRLTSTFTSGKMKMMFETLLDTTKELDRVLTETAANKEPLDVKDVLARFTTDTITSCAFGLDTSCLANPDAEILEIGKRIFDNTLLESLQFLVSFAVNEDVLRAVGFKIVKPDVAKFITKVVLDNVEYREKNSVYRKDFFHSLLQLKNMGQVTNDGRIKDDGNADHGNKITMDQLAAQVYVFFLAGFETSSTTMTWALYELSKNQGLQDRLRGEIRRVLAKHQGKVTYEAIMEMTYMDKVVYETLRMHPAVGVLNRQCTAPYDVPGTNVRLEKGTMVVIPIMSIQNDPDYYPEPEKFDPERFDEENKNQNPGLTWMPFGEGPRICIGLRFGMMQTKVGLTTILRNYRVDLNRKTKEPLVLDKKAFTTTSDSPIWLDLTKVEY